MLLRLWLSVLFLLMSGCASTPQQRAPAAIDPPPVMLTSPCQTPADLADTATAQDLASWAADWIGAFWCERDKRAGLLEAWPR